MAASKNLTPEQRSMRGMIAANARWKSQVERTPAQRRAQRLAEDTTLDEYRREIIAEQGEIPEPELSRRADCLRRLQETRRSYEASKARMADADIPPMTDEQIRTLRHLFSQGNGRAR